MCVVNVCVCAREYIGGKMTPFTSQISGYNTRDARNFPANFTEPRGETPFVFGCGLTTWSASLFSTGNHHIPNHFSFSYSFYVSFLIKIFLGILLLPYYYYCYYLFISKLNPMGVLRVDEFNFTPFM